MTPIDTLRERAGKATGPDRELDGTLWWTIYLNDDQRKAESPFGSVESAIKRYGSAGRALEQFFDSANPHCLARRAFQIEFTASIDAALALVERVKPGFVVFSFGNGDLDLKYGRMHRFLGWRCGIAPEGFQMEVAADLMKWPSYTAPTAPLAIILALLNALETP